MPLTSTCNTVVIILLAAPGFDRQMGGPLFRSHPQPIFLTRGKNQSLPLFIANLTIASLPALCSIQNASVHVFNINVIVLRYHTHLSIFVVPWLWFPLGSLGCLFGHRHALIQTIICNARNEKHLLKKLLFIHQNVVCLFVGVHTVHKHFVCAFCDLVCLCIDIHCMHQKMWEHDPIRQKILYHIVFRRSVCCLCVVFIYFIVCSRECVNMNLTTNIFLHHFVRHHIVFLSYCFLCVWCVHTLFIVCSRECVNMTLTTRLVSCRSKPAAAGDNNTSVTQWIIALTDTAYWYQASTQRYTHVQLFKIYIVHHHIPHALRTWYLSTASTSRRIILESFILERVGRHSPLLKAWHFDSLAAWCNRYESASKLHVGSLRLCTLRGWKELTTYPVPLSTAADKSLTTNLPFIWLPNFRFHSEELKTWLLSVILLSYWDGAVKDVMLWYIVVKQLTGIRHMLKLHVRSLKLCKIGK